MHRSTEELNQQLDHILQAPSDDGRVELIATRPAEDEREVILLGKLDPDLGLVGDNWRERSDYVDSQLTFMSSRVAQAVAVTEDRWALAGDQIYVDMDLSVANLPPGTRLALGDAIVEVTEQAHTGCDKFARRFGAEALRFVNVGEGRERRFRGMYARVVKGGSFRVGDAVTKIDPAGA